MDLNFSITHLTSWAYVLVLFFKHIDIGGTFCQLVCRFHFSTIISVGAKEMKTKVIGNSVAPVWNESFEMTVDSADGQLLYLEVFDEDPGKTDDELGR